MTRGRPWTSIVWLIFVVAGCADDSVPDPRPCGDECLPPPDPSICGDGALTSGEECDDGNVSGDDGCSRSCVVVRGWGCVPAGAGSVCEPICGDGMLVGDEGCDDRAAVSGDGCDAECRPEPGWLCVDGAAACSEICGDGLIVGAESCDDGNRASGDGCSPECLARAVWSPLSAPGSSPSARYRHTGVWTGSRMLVWGGFQPGTLAEGSSYDPETETWSEIAQAPVEARASHTAIWSGTEMIIFGGVANDDPFRPAAGGARYAPASNTWKSLPAERAPTNRDRHTAVWTGREMIVWGGRTGPGLSTRSGRRRLHHALWTATGMIVFGGINRQVVLNTGATYDPIADEWRSLAPMTGLEPRDLESVVWTGSQLIVWGGIRFDDSRTFADGATYLPALDSWSLLPSTGAPSARTSLIGVWTGSRMLLWGGASRAGGEAALGDGASFEPESGRWRAIPATDSPPSVRHGHTALWSGEEMLVFGGVDRDDALSSGARYDPRDLKWSPIDATAAPSPRYNHTAIPADGGMIVFGGENGIRSSSDGARYFSADDTWTPLPRTNAPTPRANHSAISTGSSMIIWGGFFRTSPDRGDYLNTGAAFDVALGTWSSLSVVGAPRARTRHSAVWTGTEMIIFGGVLGGGPSGGRYRPDMDSWAPLEREGMPNGRYSHSAIWSGREMIIWGGSAIDVDQHTTGSLGDGARFDPEHGVWTPLSTVDAPSARGHHTTVWTGTEMIIWGGGPSIEAPSLADGARYRPDIDAWVPMTEIGAPTPRSDHTAVWTDSAMIIFGGIHEDTRRGDGARFEL